MTDVFVDHLCYALGDLDCTVEESVAAGITLSGAEDLRDAGFRRHRRCSPGTTAYDLAKRCAGEITTALDGVGAIVYSTCLPVNANIADPAEFAVSRDVSHLMDFPASRLQADFGLDDAFVVGLNQQGCTGMLGSLRTARALLVAEPEIERILCITADRFPPGACYEHSYNLISDGAAACLVGRVPSGFRFVAGHHVTNGALVQSSDDQVVGSFFGYTYRVITAVLAKAGLAMDDVAWVVPQNTNVKAWQILSRLLGVEAARVHAPSMADGGHVISGDNIINLKHLAESGRIRPGDKVLLVMAGYGLNWQCTILEAV